MMIMNEDKKEGNKSKGSFFSWFIDFKFWVGVLIAFVAILVKFCT